MKTDKQTRITLENADHLIVDMGRSPTTRLEVILDTSSAVQPGKKYKLLIQHSVQAGGNETGLDSSPSLDCLLVETQDDVQVYHADPHHYHRVFDKPTSDAFVQMRVGKIK